MIITYIKFRDLLLIFHIISTCYIICCKDIRDSCPTNEMTVPSVLSEPVTPREVHGRSPVYWKWHKRHVVYCKSGERLRIVEMKSFYIFNAVLTCFENFP